MKSLRLLIRSFIRVPTTLLIASILSLVVYLLVELWLKDLPAIFEGADKVGNLISLICRTFITGYLFYVVVNQFQKERDKQDIKPVVISKLDKIIKEHATLITMLSKASGNRPLSIPTSPEEVILLFRMVVKNGKKGGENSRDKPVTWYESMLARMRIMEKEFDRLMLLSSQLNPELVALINSVVDCDYYFWLEQYKIFYRKNSKIEILNESIIAEKFADYYNKFWELQKYCLNQQLIPSDELAQMKNDSKDPKKRRLFKKLLKEGITAREISELDS